MINIQEFQEFKARIDAMKEIMRINDPQAYERLCSEDYTWAPEIKKEKYEKWLSYNYELNPDNWLVVTVYSLLYNAPFAKMRMAIEDALATADKELNLENQDLSQR